MVAKRRDIVERLYSALQRYERLFQFRDPNNACLFDLRVNECYALEIIVEQGPISVVGLASTLGVHKSNASRIARALQERAYIVAVPDANDGRSVLWKASAKGRKKFAGIKSYLVQRFDAALGDFRRADIENMVGMLQRLSDDAEARVVRRRD